MSIHKLTAGSGYDYLTRQVAAMDATDKGRVGLASYYTERGETPGVWVGSGMAGIDGLDAGDVVIADHMRHLFGAGRHPLATERTKALDLRIGRPDLPSPTEADYTAATQLGAPHKVYDNDVSPFRIEVATRLAALNEAAGLPRDWPVPAAERARIRTEVARELFRAEHGREAADARELAGVIAKHSRPRTTAVAGYDLTFSPVKSVSTLWSVADPRTAAIIERAHRAAIRDALDFLEAKALFTRLGSNGVRQVDVRGLVATAFTHRDSRAGDPDLHTHVAVANKVQTLSADGTGKWRAIDGRILFKATVAASEVYNTALERHLVDALGVRFAERPTPHVGAGAAKRPVREIVGVDPELNRRFSRRRLSVEDRRTVLAADFQATHGRPPTPVETLHLAQQATLETRATKHEPRSLAEQRQAWHSEAVEVLGSPGRLQQMIHRALHPATPAAAPAVAVDPSWFATTADRIVATMEGARATWQYWHVYAEAQRQVRAAHLSTTRVHAVADLLTSQVLDGRCVSLARSSDGIVEPPDVPALRRVDGTSVYTVAGADLYTSATVLDAEQRLVTAAGRRDGFVVDEACVAVALLESEANGVTLNAGQVALVRQMATSGARLQLAIAPAGSGKTTAMRTLTQAWTEGGGTVIGLAPSAAAADALRDTMGARAETRTHTQADTQTDMQTETLAKLTHSLTTRSTTDTVGLPGWVAGIGPSTLVMIDEAGMADTLSLDAAVSYVLDRGGSVRLVGDDQQLAAIGAGGVLRDIQATHGALQLIELIRFSDPAEGAASLALREGKPEALGFYLDRGRVHVGDLATMTEEVFAAWRADRAHGLDSIMLAPTRELVADLNRQARAHRLAGAHPVRGGGTMGPTVRLADGNEASVGELIITRANDRRLRTSATDWVKNGDRWTVLAIGPGGDLTVQHAQHAQHGPHGPHGRTVRLPRRYVETSVELGYACTVHTAQGVTADTMHGLSSGSESRQQLYTMLTRGRRGNHVYLEVVGDGDPHSVIHPDLVRPLTPTDILTSILARDSVARSASSLLGEQADPAARLGEATQRYLDSLCLAAENLLRTRSGAAGVDPVEDLDRAVDQLLPGLANEAAWPTLRAHLLLLGADGENPGTLLREVAGERELTTAEDRAAVLDWRLGTSGPRGDQGSAGVGPLPWTPDIPSSLTQDPRWGAYLTGRARLVADLADQVHQQASASAAGGSLLAWARTGTRPDPATVADVEVWRAAMQVAVEDRRPTGTPQRQKAAATHQRNLNRRVTGDHTPALQEWSHLLHRLAPQVRDDDFTPLLAERLAAMSRAGVTAHQLVRAAAAAGPLPDEHAAAALWWRIARHLEPAVAAQTADPSNSAHITATWTLRLADMLGPEPAALIQASPWWPALVANVDHGLQRGWRLEDLLSTGTAMAPADVTDPTDAAGVDECQALVWRTSIALEPIPDNTPDDPAIEYYLDEPPEDLWEDAAPPSDAHMVDLPEDRAWPPPQTPAGAPNLVEHDPRHLAEVNVAADQVDVDEEQPIERDLTLASLIRETGRHRLEPTEADIRRMYQRAEQWDHSPVTRERLLEINNLTQAYFEDQFRSQSGCWGRGYLTERFGIDLAGHQDVRPGQAPAGWSNLVQHLRRHGVTDQEMLVVGVATTARTGRLIDRFRDRVMFPIIRPGSNGGEILGFVGRRHPDLTDTDQHSGKGGPKYLNTAETPLFHKGAQLFGAVDEQLEADGIPVIVEGPMDAIAVTLASADRYVGVAPLGTALTEAQAAQLSMIHRDPIVATDADLAGQVAAERDFWMLTPHGLDPGYAQLPTGHDPAELLARRGPAALVACLDSHQPLGDQLLTERIRNMPPEQSRHAAARIIAARPGNAWNHGVDQVRERLQLSAQQARQDLRNAVATWDTDPRRAAQAELNNSSDVRIRLRAQAARTPADRWATLAVELDPRLARHRTTPPTSPRPGPRRHHRGARPGQPGSPWRPAHPRPAIPAGLKARRRSSRRRARHPGSLVGAACVGHTGDTASHNSTPPTPLSPRLEPAPRLESLSRTTSTTLANRRPADPPASLRPRMTLPPS
jgi:DNA primase catalytic core